MTGTDERHNSCSRSGTPTQGGTPVPQPVFQPAVGFNEGHRHPPEPILNHPPYGGDPFRANPAAEARHFINLNDDDEMSQIQIPAARNAAPQPILNIQGGAGPLLRVPNLLGNRLFCTASSHFMFRHTRCVETMGPPS
jgi:hypothetical protein